MGFALRLCLLLLIVEICVLANPVIPQTGLAHESPVPKSSNRQLFMVQDETPETPTEPPKPTEPATTTAAPGRSAVSTPSIILCAGALIPVFAVNKLRNN